MFNTVRMYKSPTPTVITVHTNSELNERLQFSVFKHKGEPLVNVIAESGGGCAYIVSVPLEVLEAAIATAKAVK